MDLIVCSSEFASVAYRLFHTPDTLVTIDTTAPYELAVALEFQV
jgi:hypothetical protein